MHYKVCTKHTEINLYYLFDLYFKAGEKRWADVINIMIDNCEEKGNISFIPAKEAYYVEYILK